MRKKILLPLVLFALVVSFTGIVYAAVTWNETQPAGDTDQNWWTAAISSDGKTMLAGTISGRLYLSTNTGSSWAETRPAGDNDEDWGTVGMSGNGQIMLAGIDGGRIYLSTNGGSSWTETRPAGDSDGPWANSDVSSNGSTMMVSGSQGRVYISKNSGDSWTETQPNGNITRKWNAHGMSPDGKHLIIGADPGRLYISSNSGDSWSEQQILGDVNGFWDVGNISSDGQTIIAGYGSGDLYKSTNRGTNWATLPLPVDSGKIWVGMSSTSDLGKIFLAERDGKLSISYDGGANWVEQEPGGLTEGYWKASSMSSDGSTMVAGNAGFRLYIGREPTPAPSSAGGGSSSNSNTTPTCSTTPNGAPDLFQINTTKNTSTLYFSPVGQASNYLVSYGFNSDANQFNVFTNQGLSTGVMSYTINSLPNNSTMYFKVYAQNNCGQGAWSNTMQVVLSGGTYYKNLLSQVLSIIPQKTTVLGAKTSKVLGASTKCKTYVVQSGDSLWAIANSHLGNGSQFSSIMNDNSLKSNLIHAGQTLKVGCK